MINANALSPASGGYQNGLVRGDEQRYPLMQLQTLGHIRVHKVFPLLGFHQVLQLLAQEGANQYLAGETVVALRISALQHNVLRLEAHCIRSWVTG